MSILGALLGPVGLVYEHGQKKASKKAAAAVQDAADKNNALADKIYNQSRDDLAPGRGAYGVGIDALYRELGLSPPAGATSPTSPLEPGTPPGTPAGATKGGNRQIIGYGPTDKPIYADSAPGAPAGYRPTAATSATAPAAGDPRFAPQPAPAPAQPDWKTYWDQNPDLAANNAATPTTDLTGDGKIDEADRAAEHYQEFGQSEGRALPMNPQGPPPQQPYEAIDYGDQYQRPDQPQWQDMGSGPDSADYLGEGKFQADPSYAWRQSEAARGGNASFGARGLLKSGGAIKAAQDRSFHLADTAYNDWYQQQLARLNSDRSQFNTNRSTDFNIFNTNRNNTNTNYESDRNFGYGAGRDARGDYETDRGFQAGRDDQRISNLFGLTTIGQGAAAGTAAAGNVFVNATSGNNNNVAQARANKAIADANIIPNIFATAARAAGTAAGGGF